MFINISSLSHISKHVLPRLFVTLVYLPGLPCHSVAFEKLSTLNLSKRLWVGFLVQEHPLQGGLGYRVSRDGKMEVPFLSLGS